MAEQCAIDKADLRRIEKELSLIYNNLDHLNSGIDTVNNNVGVIYKEIGALAEEFHNYVAIQVRANRRQVAHTELVRIRQELDKKYGHYDIVRRTTTGILQADDIGIVKKDTISTATEELMISAPRYWLAPCLVALAAWINDQPELAERAVKEGIKRDDEKTSLFFALICRRADRKQASLKWMQRYLANQDEENLDRKTIIVLDAYASGLLGVDSEGIVSRQMGEWLEHLAEKPNFVEQQTIQWSNSIKLKKKPLADNEYKYLPAYSKTWPQLKDVMEGANLHSEILCYFTNIFNQNESVEPLKVQLDEILNSLVSDYDDEEIPLRKEEKFEQFVIDFDGDDQRARQNMAIEQTAFETHKDFTQLLTDAAMKPESSHASFSTQKFAIALSKDWISNAYNDVTAENRMKIPYEIEVNVDSFNGKTTDGKNEESLINEFNTLVESEKQAALLTYVLSGYEKFCLYAGPAIGIIGLIMMNGNPFLGIIAIISGIGMTINHFSKKKKINENRKKIEEQFDQKLINGKQIIRATLAELVDFRAEFSAKDSESKKVIDFLDDISPEQYVKKLAGTNRRIAVSE